MWCFWLGWRLVELTQEAWRAFASVTHIVLHVVQILALLNLSLGHMNRITQSCDLLLYPLHPVLTYHSDFLPVRIIIIFDVTTVVDLALCQFQWAAVCYSWSLPGQGWGCHWRFSVRVDRLGAAVLSALAGLGEGWHTTDREVVNKPSNLECYTKLVALIQEHINGVFFFFADWSMSNLHIRVYSFAVNLWGWKIGRNTWISVELIFLQTLGQPHLIQNEVSVFICVYVCACTWV